MPTFDTLEDFLQASGDPKVANVLVAAAAVPMLEEIYTDLIRHGLQTSGFVLLLSLGFPKIRPLAAPGLICAAAGVLLMAQLQKQRQAFMSAVATAFEVDETQAEIIFTALVNTVDDRVNKGKDSL